MKNGQTNASEAKERRPVQCTKCSSYSHSLVEIISPYARVRCADCGTIHDYRMRQITEDESRRLADKNGKDEDFRPTKGEANGDHPVHVKPPPAAQVGFLTSAVEKAIAAGPAGIRQAQRVALKYARKFQAETEDHFKKRPKFLSLASTDAERLEVAARPRALWRARLEAIRDNEHIRRIEQPVYKRRWDEQWKVGNRWECGPAAYAQELVDAFYWWLSEKAEWYLEHKMGGGPIMLDIWTSVLFKDPRIAAAWPVVAKAIFEVEQHKFDKLDAEKKETKRPPKLDDAYTAFERFFRGTVLDQSVAHGIPPAKPWKELAEKKKWTSAQLKKAQAVRGKLNVPRERFQIGSAGEFFWAGK